MSSFQERIFANRYVLDVQIPNAHHGDCWRAYDQALNRWVTLQLLSTTDQRAERLINSSEQAATLETRGAIGILDVIEAGPLIGQPDIDSEATFVGIVTQWIKGTSLAEYLNHNDDGMQVVQSLKITRSIAMTMAASHAQGVIHGSLCAHNILFVDSGDTRIQGFGIDSPLSNQEHDITTQSDIVAVGNILHFMLTQQGFDIRQACVHEPYSSQMRELPSHLRSGIPQNLDALYQSTQDGSFVSMQDIVEALSINLAQMTEAPAPVVTESSQKVPKTVVAQPKRWPSVLMASLVVVILGWGGWQLLTHNFKTSGVPSALLPENFADDPLASVSPTPADTTSKQAHYANLINIRDFDPKGNGTENPELVSKAIDHDPTTAWTTVVYRRADMTDKPGVGLLLDLGKSNKVSAVDLNFTTAGQDVSVYVSQSSNPSLLSSELLGSVTNSDVKEAIGGADTKTGRYVVVWLTKLPQSLGSSYQSGITDILVRLS